MVPVTSAELSEGSASITAYTVAPIAVAAIVSGSQLRRRPVRPCCAALTRTNEAPTRCR